MEHGYSSNADDDVIPKRTFLSGLKGGAIFYMFVNDSFLDTMCGDGVQGFKVCSNFPWHYNLSNPLGKIFDKYLIY